MAAPTYADRRRAEAIADHALWLGADEPTARAVADRVVSDRSLFLLGVNGWLAAGKDVVAPKVLASLGALSPHHLFYAHALKDELNEIILGAVSGGSAADLAATFAMDVAAMRGLLDELAADLAGEGVPSAYHRTAGIRRALQVLGTDIRRAQDPDYWVKRALTPVLPKIAAGESVFATDIRFVNEVTEAQKLGFRVVRLDITRETQRQRLKARDGLEPDPAALYHASETALDDFDGFDLRVDNNGTPDAAVAQIRTLFAHAETAAAAR